MTRSSSINGSFSRLAYFSAETHGGLADYAREQVQALGVAGAQVTFVTAPSVARANQSVSAHLVPILAEIPSRSAGGGVFARRLRSMGWILGNMRRFAQWIQAERVKYVLLGAYMEYFAPLWAPQFQRLAKTGVVFGSVIHDPVRQTRLGPRWFHRRSIGAAYSFLSEAFVHDSIELETVRPVKNLSTTVIPHGPYEFPAANLPRETIRQQFRIPPHATLLLAFGHVRDAKNLDLILHAMASNPNVCLLVAGKELSSLQRPVAWYQELAVKLGVADRCRWRIGLVPEKEVGNLFEAADLVMLTYNKGFRSASGVLNVAVQYRKPCLASSGPGNLKTSMAHYALGQWIEPDNQSALTTALRQWNASPVKPDWDGYENDNSWEKNAKLVIGRMFSRTEVYHGLQ